MQRPKLRTVEKYEPLYPLSSFPHDFGLNLGKEIIYLLSTRGTPRLEGSDWEEIFARLIGAEWKPSNVGLDDVAYEQMAWGAKTVKNNKPSTVSKIRLICGRNSPVYSYGDKKVSDVDPDILGEKVLEIWNERVSAIRKLYKHLRTVVLIKSNDLLELSVFEFDTIHYIPSDYWWQWNERGNLQGYNRSEQHIFTWQPHGSQFTVIEDVPDNRLSIRIKQPPVIEKDDVLEKIMFDDSWVEIIQGREMSRKPFKLPVILTDKEVEKLLSVFNKRYISSHKNYLMCKLSLETGMRVSEVISLQVQDIDWNSGRTHIKEGKGKKDRIIFINAKLLEEIRGLVDRLETGSQGLVFPSGTGVKFDKNNINRMLKTYGEKAGIDKHFTFHTFRHTFGTKLLKETGNIRIVQKVLGHSDISTTMI